MTVLTSRCWWLPGFLLLWLVMMTPMMLVWRRGIPLVPCRVMRWRMLELRESVPGSMLGSVVSSGRMLGNEVVATWVVWVGGVGCHGGFPADASAKGNIFQRFGKYIDNVFAEVDMVV